MCSCIMLGYCWCYWVCLTQEYLDENLKTHTREQVTSGSRLLRPVACLLIVLGRQYVLSPSLPRLTPTMFGHPNCRSRAWRICWHTQRKTWACEYTLQQLCDMILSHDNCLKLNYGCYLVASNADLRCATYESDLSRQCVVSKWTSIF